MAAFTTLLEGLGAPVKLFRDVMVGEATDTAVAGAVVILAIIAACTCVFLATTTSGIPGKVGLPLLHDELLYALKRGRNVLSDLSRERRKKYGNIYRTRYIGEEVVMVTGLENVKRLLAAEHVLVEGIWPKSTSRLLGSKSLVILEGLHHLKMRKPLTRLFTPAAMRGYIPGLQAIIEGRLARWAAAEGPTLAAKEVKALALEVMMELVMGCSLEQAYGDMDLCTIWHQFTNGLIALPINLPGTTFNKALKARKLLLGAARQAITSQMPPPREGGIGRDGDERGSTEVGQGGGEEGGQREGKSMVQLMLETRDEAGEPLSMEMMQDMSINLMMAGHDTSSTTIMILLKELPRAEGAIEKLREEQRAVVAEHGEALTEAALKAMPYAEAVVREALRHTTVVAQIPRTALQDFELGGYTIRKGTKLWLVLRSALDDPQWVEGAGPLDPRAFNPSRWLDDSAAGIGLMAFGGGPRMCLGYPFAIAEIKVFLALLARSYSWELQKPDEVWTYFPFPGAAEGMPISFQPL